MALSVIAVILAVVAIVISFAIPGPKGDQATNICEQVVFMTEGRVIKHPYLSVGPDDAPGT